MAIKPLASFTPDIYGEDIPTSTTRRPGVKTELQQRLKTGTPQTFTASEAKILGVNIEEYAGESWADWQVRVSPDESDTGFALGFISPEGITYGAETITTAEGEVFTYDEWSQKTAQPAWMTPAEAAAAGVSPEAAALGDIGQRLEETTALGFIAPLVNELAEMAELPSPQNFLPPQYLNENGLLTPEAQLAIGEVVNNSAFTLMSAGGVPQIQDEQLQPLRDQGEWMAQATAPQREGYEERVAEAEALQIANNWIAEGMNWLIERSMDDLIHQVLPGYDLSQPGAYDAAYKYLNSIYNIPTDEDLNNAINFRFADDPIANMTTDEQIAQLRQWAMDDPEQLLYEIAPWGYTKEGEQILKAIGLEESTIEQMFGWREYVGQVMTHVGRVFPKPNQITIDTDYYGFIIKDMLSDQDKYMNMFSEQGWSQERENLIRVMYPDLSDKQVFEIFEGKYDKDFIGKLGDSLLAGIGDFQVAVGGAMQWLGSKDYWWTHDGYQDSLEKLGRTTSEYGQTVSREAMPVNQGIGWDFARSLPTTLWILTATAGVGAAIPSFQIVSSTTGQVMRGTTMFANHTLKAVGMAAVSRPLESTLEAGGTYWQAISEGYSKKEAGNMANSVFLNNMKLIGLDATQFMLALLPFTKLGGRVAQGLQNRNIIRLGVKGATFTGAALTEGGEEYFQQIVQMQAMGEDITPWAVQKNLSNPEIRMVTLLGIMSGGAFQGGAEIIGNMSHLTKINLKGDIAKKVNSRIAELMRKGVKKTDAEVTAIGENVDNPEVAETLNKALVVAETDYYSALIEFEEESERSRQIDNTLQSRVEATGLIGAQYTSVMTPSLRAQMTIKNQIGADVAVAQSNYHNEHKGSTFTTDGQNLAGQPYFSVSVYKGREHTIAGDTLTDQDFLDYSANNQDLLSQEGNCIGSWVDSMGNSVLDVVIAVSDKQIAYQLAREHQQEAIYDLKLDREEIVPKGKIVKIRHYGAKDLKTVEITHRGTGKPGSEGKFRKEYAPEFQTGVFTDRSYWFDVTEETTAHPEEITFRGKPVYEKEQELAIYDPVLASQEEREAFKERYLERERMAQSMFGQFFGAMNDQKAELYYATAKDLGYQGFRSRGSLAVFENISLEEQATQDERSQKPVISLTSIDSLAFELSRISDELWVAAKITPKQLMNRVAELRANRIIEDPTVIERPPSKEVIRVLKENLGQTQQTGQAIAVTPDGTGLYSRTTRRDGIFHHDIGVNLPPSSEWVKAGVVRMAWETGGQLSIEIGMSNGITQEQYDRLFREINSAEEIFLDMTDENGDVIVSYEGNAAEMTEVLDKVKELEKKEFKPTYREERSVIDKDHPVSALELTRALNSLTDEAGVSKNMLDDIYQNIQADRIPTIKNSIEEAVAARDKWYEDKARIQKETERAKTKKGADKARLEREELYSVKKTLVKFLRESLPLSERGKLLVAVRDAKNMDDLNKAAARVDQIADKYWTRVTKIKIQKELNSVKALGTRGYPVGRISPEGHDLINTIRHNLFRKSRAQAVAEMQINLLLADTGAISYEQAQSENYLLGMSGINEMSTKELMNALDDIRSIIAGGREIQAEKIKARKEWVEEQTTGAVAAAGGVKPGSESMTNDQLKKKFWSQKWESLKNHNYGLYDLMDKLSSKEKGTKPREGFFNSLFDARIHRASTNEGAAVRKQVGDARKAFADIYGIEGTRKVDKALNKMTEERSLGYFVNANGVEVELRFNRNQLVKIWQWVQDPTLDKTFRERMGWTNEMIYKIGETLTDQDIAWGQYQMDVYQQYYNRVNAVYKELYGIDLPHNMFYSPVVREVSQDMKAEHVLFAQEAFEYSSVIRGELKTRTPSDKPFTFHGANELFMKYITDMEHFIHYGELVRDMRSVFGNSEVRKAISQNHGDEMNYLINSYIDWFAAGTTEKAYAQKKVNDAANFLRRNFTLATLSKPNIAIKQLPSLFAAMSDVSTVEFAKGAGQFWKNPIENGKWLLENSAYLRGRVNFAEMERDIKLQQQQGTPTQELSGKRPLRNFLLYHIRAADSVAVIQVMYIKYNSEMSKLQKQVDAGEMTAEQAQEQAMLKAELLVESTQPTSSIQSLSAWQNGGPFMKLFTMFQNQPNKYYRLIGNNFRNLQAGRGSRPKAVSNIVLGWVILPAMFQFLADGLRWDEDHMKRILALGPLNDFLVVGQLIETGYNHLFTDEAFDYQPIPAAQTFQDVFTALADINSYIWNDDPNTTDDLIELIEKIAKPIGEVAGLPTPYIIQLEKAYRNNDWRQIFFSEWTLGYKEKRDQKTLKDWEDMIGQEKQLMDEDGNPIEPPEGLAYVPEYYDLEWYAGKVQSYIKSEKLHPEDITTANGFSELTAAVATWIPSEIPYAMQCDVPLIDINADELDDYTYKQLYELFNYRQSLTDEEEAANFDDLYRGENINRGNITWEQVLLLDAYHALETDEERKDFIEQHPELAEDPRDMWLRKNGEANGQLFLLGKAKLLSMDAYNYVRSQMSTYHLTDDQVGKIPPPNIAERYFQYQDVVLEFGGSSSEAKLFKLENTDVTEWMGVELPDNNINVLRINVQYRELDEQYNGLSDIIKDSDLLADAREAILAENPDYEEARWARYAYGKDVPEKWIDTYLDYRRAGYTGRKRDAWLRGHYDFYLSVKDLLGWGKLGRSGRSVSGLLYRGY